MTTREEQERVYTEDSTICRHCKQPLIYNHRCGLPLTEERVREIIRDEIRKLKYSHVNTGPY